MAKGKQEINV